jgi:uncharacterized protein with NAD-binding domain and iron-sulfur cluster
VVERRPVVGGKSRSMGVPGTAVGGRRPLPGEHGFRFFPGFYRHLPDTLSRIPFPAAADARTRRVIENLVPCSEFAFAVPGEAPIVMPTAVTRSTRSWKQLLESLVRWKVSASNLAYFAGQMGRLIDLPIDARRRAFDSVGWTEFTDARARGREDPEYVRYFVDGVTRSLVACRADHMSACTAGTVFARLARSMVGGDERADQVLDGPTSERWLHPWLDYLRHLGVELLPDTEVGAFVVRDERVAGVTVLAPDGVRTLVADWYVAALPLDRMQRLVSPLAAIDPRLGGITRLRTEWMSGVQIYLREPLGLVDGHVVYAQSPWALTSVEQQHHWSVPLAGYGDGTVTGILSVDVSNWDEPGVLHGRPARECTRDEVVDEVLAQLRMHLPEQHRARCAPPNVVATFVDPALSWCGGAVENDEPLLVNTIGAWQLRPEPAGAIENLVLAGDYVRTSTDLACMEGANEAARRAANAILERSGRTDRVTLFRLRELFDDEIVLPGAGGEEVRVLVQ